MKFFSILLIAVSTFILNIGLYYTSENYRLFLKNIKQENIVKEINDDYQIDKKEIIKSDLEKDLNNEIIDNKIIDNKDEKNNNTKINNKIEKVNFVAIDDKPISKISDSFEKQLLKFKDFELEKIEVNDNLMGITTEYPDRYLEYSNEYLTLYYFPTKKYNEIKEIFEIESDGEFFKLNEVDNFGNESFYINLGKNYDDGFIRFIFRKGEDIIGIKVLKEKYNTIKKLIK